MSRLEQVEHTPHREHGFVRKYIFSTDHKIVGLQYFFTAFFMALVGGLLSVLMRLQLGWPSHMWPALEKLFPVGMQNGVMAPNRAATKFPRIPPRLIQSFRLRQLFQLFGL